jgi:hypothetical protein
MLLSISVFASDEASGETTSGPNVSNVAGMLSLQQYTVENDGADSVSVICYGILDADDILKDFSGDVAVYADLALTQSAQGVTAQVEDGVLTISGIATEENTVYYLQAADGYQTVFYVVNDQYDDQAYTLALRDGTDIALSSYAPENDSPVILAGNQNLMSVDEFADLADVSDADRAAAAWWLSCGVTNGGNNLTTFGDTLHGFELATFYYRYFQILNNDSAILPEDFVTPADVYLSMGDNDQFADPDMYTLKSSVWDGLYTVQGEDGYLYNIDGVTELGNFTAVGEEMLLVSIYNVFVSPYSNLSDKGIETAAALAAAAGDDPDNAAKAAAVESVFGFDYTDILADAATQKLAVIRVLSLLDGMTASIPGTITSTQVDENGNAIYVEDTFDGLTAAHAANVITQDTVFENTDELITDDWTSLFIQSGHVQLINATVNATGASSNTSYPMGLGALVSAQGADTFVEATSTNGWPVLIGAGSGGTMAGGFYNGYGATVKVTNGLVVSPSQHPSNTVYNGTLHYIDSGVFGGGRQYSSDFWGGNIVFEDSVSVGGGVTDESTTVVYKNSYTNMVSVGRSGTGTIEVNGFGTMYFENAWIDNAGVRFQNNTSLMTDTASLILVNSVWNGASIGTIRRSEKAIIQLVDSTLNLTTDTLLTASNYVSCSCEGLAEDEELISLYGIDAAIRVYGDTYINTPDGIINFAFTTEDDFSADSPATITLYVSDIVGGTVDEGNITVVYGDQYGTLHIGVNQAAAADTSASGEASVG